MTVPTGPGDPDREPEFLRFARQVREVWDTLFPIVVGIVVVVLLVLLAFRPELRDPSLLAVIGTSLVALAGVGLKRRPPQ